MDQATLVSPDINAGQEALDALDAAQIKPLVAAFVVFPEYEDWRLVLSSPSLDQAHQMDAYQQVTKALGGRFVYRLPLILILSSKDSFVRELRKIFSQAKCVTGMRLGGQIIGNRYVSDAYVYRIK